MRIFFDIEFYENGRTIDLISIGMVREDGKEYYAENIYKDYYSKQTPWLEENVCPHLSKEAGKYPATIAKEILEFVGAEPEFWAYYADYDWVLLCQLYGTMMELPKGWPMLCMDVKQMAMMFNNVQLPKQKTVEHHALSDAQWCKEAWECLNKIKWSCE